MNSSDEDSDETETEEETSEEESDDDSIIEDSHSNQNGYTNGKKSKGYELDDFQLLKTIGKFLF